MCADFGKGNRFEFGNILEGILQIYPMHKLEQFYLEVWPLVS